MKIYNILAAITLLASCTKEGQTSYTAIVSNKSSVSIQIVPFINDKSINDKIINLKPTDSIILGKKSERGITNNSGFQNDYYGTADYMAVVFNNTDSVFHYGPKQNPSMYPGRKKYYTSDVNSNRYLSIRNYDYSYEDINTRKREAKYVYTFTNADYQFSKP